MEISAANSSDALIVGVAGAEATQPTHPSACEVRAELQKIIASPGFPATERSRKLLCYLVNETLAGREGRIKAYCIGTTVFGRPESFDPQKDPIVRIEAARLRRELEHYYLTDGATDPVVIEIPKGAYVPHFIARVTRGLPAGAGPAQAPPPAGAWIGPGLLTHAVLAGLALLLIGVLALGIIKSDRQKTTADALLLPGLIVKPLTDLTQSRDSGILAQGLTERIIERLSRFSDIAVIAGSTDSTRTPTARARYEFGGTLRADGINVLVQSRLVDRTDGRVIWADSFDVALQPKKLFDFETAIADQIATRVAEPGGAVFESERRSATQTPPESLNAYLCTLSAYAYRASFGATTFEGVRACLEKAVAEHPNYATAWALLSLTYVDEYRFSYNGPENEASPALQRAYGAASRATELDPANIRGQQAMMLTLFFNKDYAASIEVGERALALNPNDVEMKGEFGHRLALYGEWTRGCQMVREAMDNSARKIPYYKIVLSICSFMAGDMTAAASLMKQADAQDNPAYHVMAAAVLAQAGDTAGAREHRRWLEKNAPRQMATLLVELPLRLVRPVDRKRFMDALEKAGFRAADRS